MREKGDARERREKGDIEERVEKPELLQIFDQL